MGRLDGYYGKPLAEDEIEKTVETNRAIARWLDRLHEMATEEGERFISRLSGAKATPSPRNTSTTHRGSQEETES